MVATVGASRAADHTIAHSHGKATDWGSLLQRIFETGNVHVFSHATMPIFNLFRNCSYYWLFAAFVSFNMNHPGYTEPNFWQTAVCFALAYCCQVRPLRAVRVTRPYLTPSLESATPQQQLLAYQLPACRSLLPATAPWAGPACVRT